MLPHELNLMIFISQMVFKQFIVIIQKTILSEVWYTVIKKYRQLYQL